LNEVFEMSSLGKRLIDSAKEARVIARGEMAPNNYKIHVPRKVNVRAIRKRMRLTQEEFAARYRLTLARVRDWEQERSLPDVTARAYLTIIEREPKAVERALAQAKDFSAR
jgi:putative transcriptional regulator